MRAKILGVAVVALIAGVGPAQATPDKAAVIGNYADIAQAMYEDAVDKVRDLQRAVDALIATPNAASLRAARTAV